MCRRHLLSILRFGALVGAIAAAGAVVILASGAAGAASGAPALDHPVPGPAATSLEDVDRAIVLLDEAWIRWRGGADLEEVAGWLDLQPDVEWAEALDGTLRFQARGAMPLGLVSGERLEAPEVEMLPGAVVDTIPGAGVDMTPPPGSFQRSGSARRGGGAARGASLGSSPGAIRGTSSGMPPRPPPLSGGATTTWGRTPGWGWVGPSGDDGTVAHQVRDDHVISDNSDFTVKPFKRALVLGLFDWEFGPLETRNVGNRIRVGREFQCDGCVDVRATDFQRLSPTSPRCVAEPDGFCLPLQQTSWRDFLGWDAFDLIHVGTHGWQHCRRDGSCYTALATGRIGSPRESIDGVTVQVGQALQRLHRYELIRRAVNVIPVGVEYHLVGAPTVCGEEQGDRATRREERQGGATNLYDYRVTDPNSAAWELLCENGMLMEAVTDQFFRIHYPEGLPDKIIVFSACEVFKDPGLARHLAGRERSSIFGWKVPVDSEVGRRVVEHFYERLFPGIFAGGDQAAARGGGARAVVAWADAVQAHYRPIVPGLDVLARSPSRLPAPDSSDFVDKRPKELPYLVERETNAEVQDGSQLELLGVPGDGRPDSLALTVEVHGLAEETGLERFRVGFRVDGELLPAIWPLTRRLGDEAWAFEGRVPLGRDARPGERVDLDVRVEIPGGGISRWLYEDLLLMGPCSFFGRITEIRIPEPRERFQAMLGDYQGRAVVDRDGSLELTIENRGNPRTDHGTREVTEFRFTMGAGHVDADTRATGRFPVQAAMIDLERPNPFHNPARTNRSTPVLFTRFASPILRPRTEGEVEVRTFTPTRMAGSLRVPFEVSGVQGLFEAEFDAGAARNCGAGR